MSADPGDETASHTFEFSILTGRCPQTSQVSKHDLISGKKLVSTKTALEIYALLPAGARNSFPDLSQRSTRTPMGVDVERPFPLQSSDRQTAGSSIGFKLERFYRGGWR